MTTTVLYGISNCDTIRKARRWLDENAIAYEFHDYRKSGCSRQLARRFLQQFDLDVIINKRGTTWRNLPDATRNSLTSHGAIALMTDKPSIIKRPVLAVGDKWLAGFDETDWRSQLGL